GESWAQPASREASSATIKYFFMILPLDNPLGCTESQCRTKWLILSPRIVRAGGRNHLNI
ncbi:hypothetical protein JTM67_36295, partial [Pseudomonas aeruginosa]|nr:hypothetical protein [Pseudomonas aeruginosa]